MPYSEALVDGEGKHIGVVTILQNNPEGPLYGWLVYEPGNVVRSETGRTVGHSEALAAASAAASALGVRGARLKGPDMPEPDTAGPVL